MLPPHLQDLLTEAQVELPKPQHTLLLVDDETENLEVLSALLADTWRVTTATTGQDAIRLIEEGLPVDLVIADQRMVGMTGVELLSVLARQHPDIVRVVLTGYSDVDPMVDAVNRAAAWRFLVKPYEPEELRATVEEGLRLKQNNAVLRTLMNAMTQRRNALGSTLQELKDTQAQLFAVERLSTVGSAAAGIVHNLRNLSTIMTMLMAEFTRRDAPSSVRDSIDSAQREMNDLVELLENLRQLARANDGRPQRSEVDLPHFLRSTALLASMQCDAHPVDVDDSSCPARAHLDSRRLQQALLTLIDNAVRASPDGSPIMLGARNELHKSADSSRGASEWLVFEVGDNGFGMDEDTVERALQPFFSGFVPPGLGLGLEIARLVAQAHGGNLEISSQPGSGTQVRILIPSGVHYAESGIRA